MLPTSPEQLVRDAMTSRFITVAGAVVLFYDHILTLPDEHRFVWKAKASFAKHAFLLNRYVVPSVMLLVLSVTSGFGPALSKPQCQWIVFTAGMVAIVSMALANVLVLLRVLVFWQGNKKITRLLWGVYFLSFLVMTSMMLLTCARALPGLSWSSHAGMCLPAGRAPSLAAAWGASLFFEAIVISLVAYHALSNPRSAEIPLTRSLRQNGLVFFLVVFVLRLSNMFIALYLPTSMIFLTGFFIWSAVTVALNRSLLRLRRADIKHYLLTRNSAIYRTASPFGLYRDSAGPDFDQSILDEFEDIKTKVADDLKQQTFEILARKPRQITTGLGKASVPPLWQGTQGWHV